MSIRTGLIMVRTKLVPLERRQGQVTWLATIWSMPCGAADS